MRWWRDHAGVRLRSTLAAAAVVGISLAVASLGGWWLLARSLNRAAVEDVVARTATVRLEIARDGVDAADLEQRPLFGEVVQVVGADGQVLAATPPSARRLSLLATLPGPTRTVVRTVAALPQSGADEPYVVAAEQVREPGGRVVYVVVGRSVAGLSETVGMLGRLAVVGVPLLVVVAAAATYWFTGRALAPVEDLRRKVSRISSQRLSERVPVPRVQDEIGRLAATMNEMLTELESAQAAMRRFVADAGHELRSPLATIGITVDVARSEAGTPGALAGVLDDVEAETTRMARLVEDLLLLAKADEHGLRLRAEEVDLDDLVESEARRIRVLSGDRLSVRVSTVPVRVVGDRDRLAQVLRNLSDNAVRHSRTRVRLTLLPAASDPAAPGVVRLLVEDDGPGIPVGDRDRVFERFVRLDDARDRGSGGSGLGLPIAREIVQGHGGTVTVGESEWGGAALELRLPASSVPATPTGSPFRAP